MWQESNWSANVSPACKRPIGCPAGDLIRDDELTERFKSYLEYKQLNRVNSLQVLQEECLKKAGLFDDVDTLIKCETVYAEAEKIALQNRPRK